MRHLIALGHRIVLVGLGALLASCTLTLPVQPEAAGPELLVEIRGAWWPRVLRVQCWPDSAPTLDSADDGAERFAAWRTRCRALSVAGFDSLRAASAGRLPLEDSDRSDFYVVPSPDSSLAVIRKPKHGGWQLADLRTGTERPWPAELESRLVYPVAWSGDGRLLALQVRDDDKDDSFCRLVILDVAAGRIVHERPLRDGDVAWSEDGARLAILERRMEDGQSVLDRMGASYGHGPGVLAEFELVIVDLADGHETRIQVRGQVRSGRGELLWDDHSTALVLR